MAKPSQKSEKKDQARFNETLRRMLSTPPTPHAAKTTKTKKPKVKQSTTKKKPAK